MPQSSRPRQLAHALAPPPRFVPPLVRVRLHFGGTVGQLGWGLIGFGLIFVWAMVADADLVRRLRFATSTPELTRGTVVGVRETNASENEVKIVAVDYTYAPGGAPLHGTSYLPGGRGLKGGERVAVEYLPGRPEISRVEGMRCAKFGWWALFTLIFPVVGAGMAAAAWRTGRHAARLLREGKVAGGRLLRKVKTNVEVNEQPIYRLTFGFLADDGRRYEAVAKTHEPELLEDDAEEQLLYLPTDPRRSTLVDHLPGAPRVDERGEIHEASKLAALGSLVIPTLTVVGNLAYLAQRLLG